MFFWLKSFLEEIDGSKDQVLSPFIRKYWPQWILPNHLTIFRMILALIIIPALIFGFASRPLIFIMFFIAILFDLLDGTVARALDKKTHLGAFLDLLADKILILPLMIYILFQNHFWLLLFLILPEIISGLTIIYLHNKKRIIKSNIFGKTKMVLESIAFAIILLSFPSQPCQFSISLLYIAIIFAFLNPILNFVVLPAPKIHA